MSKKNNPPVQRIEPAFIDAILFEEFKLLAKHYDVEVLRADRAEIRDGYNCVIKGNTQQIIDLTSRAAYCVAYEKQLYWTKFNFEKLQKLNKF